MTRYALLTILLLIPIRAVAQTPVPANPLWHEPKIKNYLPHMSWPEVQDLRTRTDMVIIPIAALEQHKPDILGMSALLTTTMPYMKVVIQTLKDRGIRDDYIVLVGGAPLNEEFGMAVGADAYCRDAAVASETAQALVMARRAAATA